MMLKVLGVKYENVLMSKSNQCICREHGCLCVESHTKPAGKSNERTSTNDDIDRYR